MPDYEKRQALLRRRTGEIGLDACWLATQENVRYICGFAGEDSALLVTADRTTLLTDSRYTEQAERETVADEIITRHTTMARTLAGLCRAPGVRTLGFTAANVPHAAFLALRQEAASVELRALQNGPVEKLRRRKDAEEVEAIRRALRTAEEAFQATMREVKPGRTERWLAGHLEFEMRKRGAEDAAFDIICAADARASVPHARPGETALNAGSSLLVDWGARQAGYCSDLTRTFCVDRISDALRDATEVVLEAQAAVLDRLKPGNTCGEADAAGRAVIARAGHGGHFGHSIGHGVGLEVHEAPRLGPGSEMVLLPGMVVTIEPGIYIPGELGVRIEDIVLITAEGYEVLTSLPRRPEQLQALLGSGASDTN